MFTIIPYGKTTVQERLGQFAGVAEELLSSVHSDSVLPSIEMRPAFQLSHQDISEDEIEHAMGFAGITKANGPIGLPVQMQVQQLGRDLLLFSLSDLEAHLRTVAPVVIAEYERSGSMVAFTKEREITAFEYLVAGAIDCIRWCLANRAALIIRW